MTSQNFLMIPDSVSDRILLFDPNDGSLIDDNFIDGSEDTGLGIFETSINAVQVNEEIWVSDQVADAIFRFDLEGNYLSVVNDNDNDGDTDNLDNIRGIEVVDDLVYVANSGDENDAPGDGEVVVVFDTAGNNLGFFDTGDPYDILAYNGELLINDINSEDDGGEDIDRYSIDGVNSTLLGTFVESDGETGVDFPQQMTIRESNGNILVGGFSAPGGIYEYDENGDLINVFDADDGFANRLRAAYELDNGNIIWSGGDGAIVTNPDTGEDTEIYTVNNQDFRPSVRYIEPLIISEDDNSDAMPVFGTINADILEIEGSNQLIFAGDMNDLVDASTGEGNNRIYAGSGDDTLILGESDRIFAGEGSDRFFITSGGDNTITGAEGADQFWIATAEIPDSANIITDFTAGEDVIGIAGLGIGFEDVSITELEGDALISASGSELAILQGIAADSLTADDFAFG